jgi:uncharacterized membrane protein YkvA (DUF1232 family)
MSRRRRKAAMATAAASAMQQGPAELGSRAAALPGLIRDTLSGDYPGLTKQRLALMLGALLYLVSPIDLVPEALLLIPGLLDDIAVAGWLVTSALGATAAYRAWRMGLDPAPGTPSAASAPSREQVIVGEVIG